MFHNRRRNAGPVQAEAAKAGVILAVVYSEDGGCLAYLLSYLSISSQADNVNVFFQTQVLTKTTGY